jgi:hypothetical protein
MKLMSKDENIITKINDITNESDSQKDRNNIKEITRDTLYTFVNKCIEKSTSTSGLRAKVQEMLLDKLEKETDDVPYGVLIKLEEILSKGETEAATPILKLLEASIKAEKEQEQLPPPNINPGLEGTLTTEELKKFKESLQLLEILGKLKQTEFNEGEK